MQQLVFTFVGDDKAGLVEHISELVSAHGGNWLESRLSQMAGKFAGIVSVGIAEKDAETLLEALASLADTGLSVIAERCNDNWAQAQHSGLLTVLGNDRPGIVHEISAALAAMDINIQELSSEVQSAPMAGMPLFSAKIAFELPQHIELSVLQDKLDDRANHLDVDISLELNRDD